MRIAAGVLIIVVAALDLFGSLGYLGIGSVATTAGRAGEDLIEGVAQGDPAAGEAREVAKKAQATGGKWTMFGLFLLAMSGLGIACGVVLFREKAAIFVMIVGGLQIVADIIGCAMWSHVGVTNIFALAVGAFVIFVGSTYLPKSTPPQPEAI